MKPTLEKTQENMPLTETSKGFVTIGCRKVCLWKKRTRWVFFSIVFFLLFVKKKTYCSKCNAETQQGCYQTEKLEEFRKRESADSVNSQNDARNTKLRNGFRDSFHEGHTFVEFDNFNGFVWQLLIILYSLPTFLDMISYISPEITIDFQMEDILTRIFFMKLDANSSRILEITKSMQVILQFSGWNHPISEWFC